MDSRERIAQNFVRNYGVARLQRLLNALSEGESGQIIAEEFDVSRERVRQWKNAFGRVVTLYQVHPEVQRVMDRGEVVDQGDVIDLDIDL